jgi:isopropylmalate/homocitrate/citramalate synthase
MRFSHFQLRRFSSASSASANKLLLHDVTARDGLQNEAVALPLAEKLKLIRNVMQYKPNGIEVCQTNSSHGTESAY